MPVASMTKVQVLIHSAENDMVVKHIYEMSLIQAIEMVGDSEEPRLQTDTQTIRKYKPFRFQSKYFEIVD